ncbi:hypothetical protein LCGC14_3153690 [marine sediment metagenome]|uniref:Uncharacterized protein n=1 Tax=marine sediment metagenome TaxID=412755 RepID=A0A0F8VTB5_9ZZZZ
MGKIIMKKKLPGWFRYSIQYFSVKNPEEIDKEIDLYDWEPSKENRIQLIKEWLARLQEKFELPFVLDEKDYSQIHDLLYQTSGTGKNSSNNS